MSRDVPSTEAALRAAYGPLAPEPGVEAELERALESAAQEPASAPSARGARWLAVPLAASLLAGVAWWWGTRHEPAGPPSGATTAKPGDAGDDADRPPTVAVRLAADGAITFSVALGKDRFTIHSRHSFADATQAPETVAALQRTLATMKEGVASAGGARGSRLRLVLAPELATRWAWVTWTMQAAATAGISDVAYADPEDPRTTIAHPLPKDGALEAPGAVRRVSVALFAMGDAPCDRTASGIVEVLAVVRGARTAEAGPYAVLPGRAANERRTAALDVVLDALRGEADAAKAAGATLQCVVEAPPPNGPCVPYGAVYDALLALERAAVGPVLFAGAPAPRRPAGAAASVREELATRRVRDVHFDGTLEAFATMVRTITGLEARPSERARETRVVVDLPDGSVEQLLDAACKGAGLRWDVLDRTILLRPKDGDR
ncbi:MAG: hypothetical protein IT460_07955 [Planctomycetes bacterium]|nr:hypothetical protein [Planctomycetota bacterium]